MNLRLSLTGILFLSFAANAIAQNRAGTESGSPRLKLHQSSINVGSFWLDSPATGSFIIRNEGDAPLEIVDISAARGLNAVLQPPGAIVPQESAKLSVTFDGAELGAGSFEKTIFIASNDPMSKRMRLKVAGECKHYVSVTPKSAGFGKLIGAGRTERMLRIVSNDDQPLEVQVDAPESLKRFKVELIEIVPKSQFALYINTVPPFPIGMHSETIRLRTNHPKQATIEVDAFAIQPESIEVLPKVISLRPTSFNGLVAGKPSVQVISVTNRGDAPVKVKGVKCTDKSIKASVSEVYEGRQYRVRVDVPADYEPPATGADVLIETDSKEQPVLTVGIGRITPRRSNSPTKVTTAADNTKTNSRSTKPRTRKRRPVLDTVGKPVPEFNLTTTVGTPLSNAELSYHPATVLNFVAPNCGFCKKQIPKVEKVREAYEAQGVRFVNVAQKMRIDFEPEEISSILGDLGPGMEIALDSGNQVGRRFKATAYPCLIIVRPDGVIDEVVSGNKRDIAERVGQRLDSLLQGNQPQAKAG